MTRITQYKQKMHFAPLHAKIGAVRFLFVYTKVCIAQAFSSIIFSSII